jgi:hypothetical protein
LNYIAWGFGIEAQGSGLRVQGLGVRVDGLVRVYGVGFGAKGLGFRV